MNNDHIKLQCLATCYRENYQDKPSSTATTFFLQVWKDSSRQLFFIFTSYFALFNSYLFLSTKN